MPSDMPQSLCALDPADTGKEESSAKRERKRPVKEEGGNCIKQSRTDEDWEKERKCDD